jgi:thioredoxin reductase (NADPH)
MSEKVVIIGSGPAGWTAAIYSARANLQPLVFEGAVTAENQQKGTLPLGQLNLTTEVENYPAFPQVDAAVLAQFSKTALPPERYANLEAWYEGKSAHHGKRAVYGPEMMEYMRQQAINFGTRIITDDITQVDFRRHPFVLRSLEGKTVEALAVIIATGARANYLGLPSEDRFKNNGVSACAVCDGALPRFRNKPLVVVGGGDSAVEEGTYLTKFASKVYVAHRRNELRASKIMRQRLLSNPKVEMKWNRVLTEVLGNDKDGVTGVRLKSTVDDAVEELAASGMFCAIGHTPNTDFLKGQIELDEKGYIKWQHVNRSYTNIEGVFAAGDVADNYYRQAVTAAGTGCMAALDAERWLAAKGFAH